MELVKDILPIKNKIKGLLFVSICLGGIFFAQLSLAAYRYCPCSSESDPSALCQYSESESSYNEYNSPACRASIGTDFQACGIDGASGLPKFCSQIAPGYAAVCPSDYPALSCKIYQYLYVCGEPGQAPCQISDLVRLAQGIINILLFIIVTPVALGLLLWAGGLYLTSPSKPEYRKKAKTILETALKGYIIALVGYIVVKTLVLGMVGTNEVAEFIKTVFQN